MSAKVLVERDGPVTILTIDRPGVHNCVDAETAPSLERASLRADRASAGDSVAAEARRGGATLAHPDVREGLRCFRTGDRPRRFRTGDRPLPPEG